MGITLSKGRGAASCLGALAGALVCCAAPMRATAQMDLTAWTLVDPYALWSVANPTSTSCRLDEAAGTGSPVWVVSPFVLPDRAQVWVTVQPLATTDDDFIGIAFSYQSNTQFMLLDWKQLTQAYNFGDPVLISDDIAEAGMKVKAINGSWTRDGLWGGTDGLGVATLAGPVTPGWVDDGVYAFEFAITPGRVVVNRNGIKVFDVQNSAVTGGRIALYAFSQDNVVFSDVYISVCDSVDFNADGVFPDTGDIADFLTVFSGGPCSNDPYCGDIDFNNDDLFPDTADIESLLNVFAGAACV